MTQKELAYIEDAIGHEQNIIKICDDIIKNMDNQDLIKFMQNEVNIHNTIKNNLINMLEVKSNGW